MHILWSMHAMQIQAGNNQSFTLQWLNVFVYYFYENIIITYLNDISTFIVVYKYVVPLSNQICEIYIIFIQIQH